MEKILLDADSRTFYQFGFSVEPSEAYWNNTTWTSSAPAVAAVDRNGLVKAIGPGTAVIKATEGISKKSASVTVTVRASVHADSLRISGPAEIPLKKTGTLTAVFDQKYQPSNPSVTWSSSDVSIAKITQNGVVTGLKGGAVLITACSQENAAVCAEFPLMIVPAVTKAQIFDLEDGSRAIDIASGKPYRLATEVTPAEALQTVTWKSSAPKRSIQTKTIALLVA